ncbi:ABC transporter permease subunit [Paenibacillus aurantius]|uniref:ABC transporter permease subunit n=1 Tax=Paenibacillus aurantius TaxID=2918900 RepID=A0AA96RF67_9BACL|nr:ABC transporter permease subunit [Paenibacillus aurantius]WJH35853.1 ABC transporter permease subunit [Paenibacillus sp. CC-CFT747]WNQ11141.1 ABC transporter permease subunit [Paenibacillus aurantius]
MLRKAKSVDSWVLLLIAVPGLLHFLIFKYIPLAGNWIAFQDYNLFAGLFHSKWVGLKHFRFMFEYPEFLLVLKNSLRLGLYSIVFGFPAPLILALLLNEIRLSWFKRTAQTLLYLPHFLSWVIVGGIFTELLSNKGLVNQLLVGYGGEPVSFLTEPRYFLGILISLGIWKEVGWSMIVYLAAMTGINPNLYEAAMVDGAGRFRQMWSITLPSLLPAIIVLLLLRIGHLLDANVEQVLFFLNPLVREVGEVFDTYVYRVGLMGGQYSYTTAIGIFKALVGILLVMGLNKLSRRTTGESIY